MNIIKILYCSFSHRKYHSLESSENIFGTYKCDKCGAEPFDDLGMLLMVMVFIIFGVMGSIIYIVVGKG